MKSDVQIQTEIMEKIKSDPFLVAAEIGVAVKNGIVTLAGEVRSFETKAAIEKIVKRTDGVKAFAEDIQIEGPPFFKKTDKAIAEEVFEALKDHILLQKKPITIKVENGIVRLEGEVDHNDERIDAKNALKNITGVTGVINLLTIVPSGDDLTGKILLALDQSPHLDSDKISALVIGSVVTLTGKVNSQFEKEHAEKLTSAIDGVSRVGNEIEIDVLRYEVEM